MLLGAGAKAAGADVPVKDYIRLHVLAEDDSAQAQALKLEVRDACLVATRALMKDCADPGEAWETLNDNLELVALAARLRAWACGYAGDVACETGVYDFPDRRYGAVDVPAGEYRALRVVIGGGAGHNWWCVLYPSLCLDGEYAPGEPVQFHSTLIDWLRALLGGGQ